MSISSKPEPTTVDLWKRLMRSFPSDGWDGAGEAIARHDRRVCGVERALDLTNPAWRDNHGSNFHPRTRDPRT